MAEQTENVKRFVAANAKSSVVYGAGFPNGGGSYKLANGKSFELTLAEARSLIEAPRWKLD